MKFTTQNIDDFEKFLQKAIEKELDQACLVEWFHKSQCGHYDNNCFVASVSYQLVDKDFRIGLHIEQDGVNSWHIISKEHLGNIQACGTFSEDDSDTFDLICWILKFVRAFAVEDHSFNNPKFKDIVNDHVKRFHDSLKTLADS